MYHIKCIETSSYTNVVRSPAVSRFVKDVAEIASLNTTPEFHFRFDDRPISDGQPTRWTVYNPHDQLALIAKLVYLTKINTNTASFQAMVMENHVVTATCIKDMSNRYAPAPLLCVIYYSLSPQDRANHHGAQRHHKGRHRQAPPHPVRRRD
jgi:hypothetical protein